VCDVLAGQSYKYALDATETVGALQGTPPPSTSPALGPFTFNETVQGKVDGGKNIEASVVNSSGSDTATFQVIEVGGVEYLNRNTGSGWTKESSAYIHNPADTCTALAPDIDTRTLATGQPQTVNGIDTHMYTITAMKTQFVAREPAYGSGSDAGTYANTMNGTIWIADSGNYVAKMDLTTAGTYPSGQPISVELKFEVSDMGNSQGVSAPQ
jgi:hypothetical protein